jgi:transcriptional regulator with XRE-family HTH domain
MNLRSRLVEARKKAGLTQAQVAKRAGVSRGTVGSWETEEDYSHGIRVDRLEKVARAYKTTVAELIA